MSVPHSNFKAMVHSIKVQSRNVNSNHSLSPRLSPPPTFPNSAASTQTPTPLLHEIKKNKQWWKTSGWKKPWVKLHHNFTKYHAHILVYADDRPMLCWWDAFYSVAPERTRTRIALAQILNSNSCWVFDIFMSYRINRLFWLGPENVERRTIKCANSSERLVEDLTSGPHLQTTCALKRVVRILTEL